jgi:hypothetical protein
MPRISKTRLKILLESGFPLELLTKFVNLSALRMALYYKRAPESRLDQIEDPKSDDNESA